MNMPQILIAEDDDLIAHALTCLLEEKGCFQCASVRDAGGLSHALEESASFKAIILDLHMPGMGGFESVKAIKQKAADCPILVFTGDNQVPVVDLFSAGVSGVVFKTSGLPVILSALAEVISGRRFVPENTAADPHRRACGSHSRTRINVHAIRRRLLLRGVLER